MKSPSRGRVSARAVVAPEALEESLFSSKRYERCPTGQLYWGGCPATFSAGIGTLSAGLGTLSAGTVIWRSALAVRGTYANSGGFGLRVELHK